MEKLLKYTTDILEQLVNIPSPTGFADEAIDFVKKEFDKLGIENYQTYKRALIGTIPGKEKDAITFSGHVDTLGAMVKGIRENGTLIFHRIGGYPFTALERENCVVITEDNKRYSGTFLLNNSSVHCHPKDVESGERNAQTMSVILDEDVHSREDVEKLGIQVGDYIGIDPRFVLTENGFIKSRHLDDKACVACMLAYAKLLKESGKTPEKTINFFISNYEELGHGAVVLPENTKDLIVVDMSAPDPGQTSDEMKVTICAMDSSGPYDVVVKKELVKLARENNLDYSIDIYPFYGSDGSAALRAGHDIRVGLIGPGVAHSHTYERSHIKGLENTIKLMEAYVK